MTLLLPSWWVTRLTGYLFLTSITSSNQYKSRYYSP